MTKAILFDFWGTLAEIGVWSPIKQIKNLLQIDMPFSEYVVRMERAMMAQEYSSLKEAFQAIFQEFNIEENEEVIEQLIGIWNKSWMLAHPYPETLETLNQLKENHQIILIANTDNFSLPRVLEKFQLSNTFHRIFFSHQLGAIKTDKIFLKTILAQLQLQPEDCLLVGDSIQSDIIPAKRAGLKAILIDRKNNRDFHPKIKKLDDLEKVLNLKKI